LRPDRGAANADTLVETRHTKTRTRRQPGDPQSIERGVRQMLADKVSGHLGGLWLLVAEHLRLGTWDLLRGWTGCPGEQIEPRLALQMVHEAALCLSGVRNKRTLTHRGGFELTNGLPFIGGDSAIHELLAEHTIQDAQRLQVALGKLRLASGDFRGKVLIIDPHRMRSYSKRHMRMRCKMNWEKPAKMAQTFWIVDADTRQPLCFTTATASRTVAQATPELLDLMAAILSPREQVPLVLADAEHCCLELIEHVLGRDDCDMLVPQPAAQIVVRKMAEIPQDRFTRRWAGFATTRRPYRMKAGTVDGCWQYVQRSGERPDEWRYKGFLGTMDCDEVEPLTIEFPKRWHVEEYFNAHQPMGWKRAGTLNLNIRYGQMSMALIAQAVVHQLRCRLGESVATWDADHFAKHFLHGLDADVRVRKDTIVVTYYNAPDADLLRHHYEELPDKLERDHIPPQIPWLYGFKLDFRFR